MLQTSICTQTHVSGERVVAIFPVIGGERCIEAVVITTDDDLGPRRLFTPRRLNALGAEVFTHEPHRTFPAALRFARQNCGWG